MAESQRGREERGQDGPIPAHHRGLRRLPSHPGQDRRSQPGPTQRLRTVSGRRGSQKRRLVGTGPPVGVLSAQNRGFAGVQEEDPAPESQNAGRKRQDGASGRQSAGGQPDGGYLYQNRYYQSRRIFSGQRHSGRDQGDSHRHLHSEKGEKRKRQRPKDGAAEEEVKNRRRSGLGGSFHDAQGTGNQRRRNSAAQEEVLFFRSERGLSRSRPTQSVVRAG